MLQYSGVALCRFGHPRVGDLNEGLDSGLLETSPFGQTVWPGHCRHHQTKAAKFKGNWQKLKGISACVI
jgi:hypothetical protein